MSRDLGTPAPRTVKMNKASQLKALLACNTGEEVHKLVVEYPDLSKHSAYGPKRKAVWLLDSQLSPAIFSPASFRPQFRQEKADLLRNVMADGKTIYCYGQSGTGRTHWFKTFFGADMRVCGGSVSVDDILRGLNKWPKIIQWDIHDGSSFKKEEVLNFVSPGEVPWLYAMKLPESYCIPKQVYRVINTWLEPKELMALLGSTLDEIDKFMASIYVWKVDMSLLENETATIITMMTQTQGPNGNDKGAGDVPVDVMAEQVQAMASAAAGKRKRTL